MNKVWEFGSGFCSECDFDGSFEMGFLKGVILLKGIEECGGTK